MGVMDPPSAWNNAAVSSACRASASVASGAPDFTVSPNPALTRVTRPEQGENTGVARSPLTATLPSVNSSLAKPWVCTTSTVKVLSCCGVARKVPGGDGAAAAGQDRFVVRSFTSSNTGEQFR
jgi:hypothetical protein